VCIYTTTLEPILARISEIDERSAPPPAAAKRRPASQKNFLCNFNLRAPLKNYSKKEKKVFLLDSALTRGRRDSLGQLTGKKFPPLEPLHFLPARRNSCINIDLLYNIFWLGTRGEFL